MDSEGSNGAEPSYGRRMIIVVAIVTVVFCVVVSRYSNKTPEMQRTQQDALYMTVTNAVTKAAKDETPVAFIEQMQLQPQVQANSSIAYSGWFQVDGGTNGPLMRWFSVNIKESSGSNSVPEARAVQIYTNEPRRH